MSRNLILTLILLGISILLFVLGYGKHQLRIDTLKTENLITVTISDIDCYGTRGNSALIFKHNGGVHIINLTRGRCEQYKIGEQVKVYYNAQSDWYLLGNDGKEQDDIWGMLGAALIFIVVLIYLFRTLYLEKYSAKKKNRK